MEPPIRYCTASDGIRIAYRAFGSGPGYVIVPAMYGSIEASWASEDMRARYLALAREVTVVQYDKRGTGLSDREIADYSVEARVRDLEAVVSDLGLRRFTLTGASEGGPVAMLYAARHPGNVARLVLVGTYASGSELKRLRGDFGEALLGLINAEWDVGSRTLGDIINPQVLPPDAKERLAQVRAAVSGEHVTRMIRAMAEVDLEPLLPEIKVPTLVIHGRNDEAIPFELGRRIAGAIPGAVFHADDEGHMAVNQASRAAVIRQFVAPRRRQLGRSWRRILLCRPNSARHRSSAVHRHR